LIAPRCHILIPPFACCAMGGPYILSLVENA
jgi:hypothetical protein